MVLISRLLRWRPGGGPMAGVFWSTVWLAYLAIPLLEIWTSGTPVGVRVLMTALIGVFVACYVTYWCLLVSPRGRAWRTPGAVVVAAVGVGAALWGGPYGLGYVLCYVGAAVAVALVPRFRLAMTGVAATAAAAIVLGVISRVDTWSIVLQAMIVLSGGAGVLGYVVLDMQNDRLRQAREEIARLAVAEERLRFSRDLHDLLGHSLSVIVLKAELAHRMADRSPERTAHEVADIEKVAREALREVREAVAGYRQPSLTQELEGAAGTLRQAGLQVQVTGAGGALPGPLDGALAWTVREATTNVIRHAQAHRVRFEVVREGSRVQLHIVNDGHPTEPASPTQGNGLRGLRERLTALGGQLEFGPGQVDGFSLTATLPVPGTGDQTATAATA